jgi:hypothetical protein
MSDEERPATDDAGVELHLRGPAVSAGVLVDALRRHGVDVVDWGDAPLARTLDADDEITVPVTVRGSDDAIEAAVIEFVAEWPEAAVQEANAGLG